MAPQREPISVRTTRLNNIILNRSCFAGYGNGAIQRKSIAASRRSAFGTASVSTALSEALTREGLLDAFCLLYNECSKDSLKKRDRNIAEFVHKYRPIVEEAQLLRANADDFTVKTLIGKGYFGNVHLVIERQTNDVYAMKKIKKSVVTTSQVKEERDIMARRSSEWITNLQYAFQDTDNLYLIMEFLPGGDLLSLMSRQGPFHEELARFYLSELTLAIHSLHEMGYVHRDIKPENILIDRFGHIKLADFGNAAALDRDGHVFSLSPVGTPDYIAPELLQTISTYKLTKSMHDVSCDFWSMGIIGYELICEITPFHEENVHETYSKILSHCEDSHLKEIITFPADIKVSENYKNLIGSLVTNPTNRLPFEKIKLHPFFESIKWETLRSQVPPIIPTVNSDDDTSNFEDVIRNKRRTNTFVKKSITTNVQSNEFCGKDLPFIGYSFVHMAKQSADAEGAADDARFSRLNIKIKDLQANLKERVEEINKLKQHLIRAEQAAKQSDTQSKILQDAKDEINKMKNVIKEKTMELAACKTQIKTLQSSVKVEEEMWEKKEATITELLRVNRQKYEEAKIASEQRYEKLIAEKKHELANIIRKLDARESELNTKADECKHLQEKMENYKEMLRQFKDQALADKEAFEKNKLQLSETYEQKLTELRSKLRNEKDSRSRLTLELREVRNEVDESISTSKSLQESKLAIEKNNDEILKRLNRELEENNSLHAQNAHLEQQLESTQKTLQEQQLEINRLERELNVAECSKNLAQSELATQQSTPYETAPGSLTELHLIEEQLRADLEAAKENENVQKSRADKLQHIVEKLEEMLEKFNEQTLSQSPMKCAARGNENEHSVAHNFPSSVGDMLEKQNEKLEDRLAAVREQMIIERQAARTANLSLWKVEKQLEEAIAEKKMTQRRMELTEDKIKKIQAEKDEALRQCKTAQSETNQRDERIRELRDEICALKREVMKEHRMWEKAEQERMQCKSEIIEHISNVQKLEERLSELSQKLQQTQQKNDAILLENTKLQRELNEERERSNTASDASSHIQIELKNLQDNYERLKYACTITDSQLTEVESMLEVEQNRNKTLQEMLDKLNIALRKKEDAMAQLRKELSDEQAQKCASESRVQALNTEIGECAENLAQTQKKLVAQQQQLMDQTNHLFQSQERVEVLTNETSNLQTINENHERELTLLKEENARILSELFHTKEHCERLQQELRDALENSNELHAEIAELQEIMAEKESFYVQRDIKSEATLAQHKKLIDYLQLKVEDLSHKKKLTFAEKLFGSGAHSTAGKKENISPAAVETSILYRTLKEELRREKQRCKTLQDQIDKLNGVTQNAGGLTGGMRSPLKCVVKNEENIQSGANKTVGTLPKTSRKQIEGDTNGTTSNVQIRNEAAHHRFELALQETNTCDNMCIACKKPLIAGSPYWKCKECKISAHRKCRGDVHTTCGSQIDQVALISQPNVTQDTEDQSDIDSLSKYSYEGKLDEIDGTTDSRSDVTHCEYSGNLIFCVEQQHNSENLEPLEINCAYEIEEQKILILGCNTGLFALHIQQPQRLMHIAGIDSVSCIAVSLPLAKAVLIGARGESLFQCDFRQLLSRSQSSSPYVKNSLEASVLDLPFCNRATNEKWQMVKISNEADNALDSVAIAATSSRIVIMKYDLKQQKFAPVRALDTATPVSSILFTRLTAIVSSDKFFEIDLETYAAEEFADLSDHALSHIHNCQPVVALRISSQEFLLCFMECGIFVDEYGCRSRPYDLNWEYTPTGFIYREPFLYIAHFQSVQILRIHRSYTKELVNVNHMKDMDADVDDSCPSFKRIYLRFYMPTLLTESGKLNIYMLAIQKETGLQQIYHLDSLQAFRQKLNESLETISSIATAITTESLPTSNPESID
ncbi:citron Rho-interacting kinase-like [Zeugodacus cucurbitae]|uniref:citron Rho-interacting kinase-like n=1 Tax=Zeugodacus cucurbitae TaxID=28588 RepID=UPI0023D91E04|nr:citron Rho-interacting kinase-like [Zeugodacus cucurbitae]